MKRGGNVRRPIINILIVCLYGFPFGYFSMHQDYSHESLIGYIIMVVGMSFLALCSKYFSNIMPFIIGNLVSVIMSFYFLYRLEVTAGPIWSDGYFKPLTPHQLLLFISLLNLIPQYFAMKLADRKKKS